MKTDQLLDERDHLRPLVGRQQEEGADQPQAFHFVQLFFFLSGIHSRTVGRTGKICNPLRDTFLIHPSRFGGMVAARMGWPMKWIRERDALIAQTLAFVQSVTGKKDEFHPPERPTAAFEVTPDATIKAVTIEAEPQAASPPPEPPRTLQVPPPRMSGDFRTEMQVRIANFRKHQERFEREREDYCAATLTKLRAAIRDGSTRPPAEE